MPWRFLRIPVGLLPVARSVAAIQKEDTAFSPAAVPKKYDQYSTGG
jgi:hypothetical protein